MKTNKLLILVFSLVFLIQGNTFGQNNQLGLHFAPFHYFSDGSPVMNTSYPNNNYGGKSKTFFPSLGIHYQRKINPKNAIAISLSTYSHTYSHLPEIEGVNTPYRRNMTTLDVSYLRPIALNDKFDFTYGGGLSFKMGFESIRLWNEMNSYIVTNEGVVTNMATSESDLPVIKLGIHLLPGFSYTPIPLLSIFTQINITANYLEMYSLMYSNKAGYGSGYRKFLKEEYGVTNYPNIFELSWRIGVAFNFGK